MRGERGRSHSQKFTRLNQPPRVHIEYEFEQLYSMQSRVSPPFVIGVLADFGGQSIQCGRGLGDRKFVSIDLDNFDDVLCRIAPILRFTVPDILDGGPPLQIDLAFNRLYDFSPGAVAGKVPPLNKLLVARSRLATLLTFIRGKENFSPLLEDALEALDPDRHEHRPTSPVDRTFPETVMPADPTSTGTAALDRLLDDHFKSSRVKEAVKEAVATLARCRAERSLEGGDVEQAIGTLVPRIDALLSRQLDLILHHPAFQRLEGAWRGLHFLVSHAETGERLKIKVLDLSKQELALTISKFKGAWEQSPLFRKIYKQEFSLPGGEIYSCLVADFQFDHRPPDVETLDGLARIAEVAMSPVIANASPGLFGWDSWSGIRHPREIAPILSGPDHEPWRSFRKSERSRFVALTLPRMLARLPYGSGTHPVEEFDYTEGIDAGRAGDFTWAGSAYAMAANLARAFHCFGIPVRISGLEGGGLVEGLPLYSFQTSEGQIDQCCPTEIGITERREAELVTSGLSPLCHFKNTNYAVFFNAPTLHEPMPSGDREANARSRLASRLPHLFYGCRFGQVLCCQIRDKIGSFMERVELEEWLNQWIGKYVGPPGSKVSEESRARSPLAGANVRVNELAGNPGCFTCELTIVPYYQLEDSLTPVRLVFMLPPLFQP